MPTERGRRPLELWSRALDCPWLSQRRAGPVALDRSKRPPRSVARQATFLGETEPRAARPMGASLRVRQLGAIRKACQRNLSPRFVPMPIGPAAGGGERPGPCQARGAAKAFLTSDARMRYTLAYVEPRLYRPDAAPTLADERRGDPAHLGRRGQLYRRITKRSATEPLGPHCSTPPGYGRPIRHQPPARTRPVLRSAAQSQNPHLNIVISLSKLAWFSRRQD